MGEKGVFRKRLINLIIAFVMLFSAICVSTGCAPKGFKVTFVGGAEDAVLEWGEEVQTITFSSQIVEPIYTRPGYNFVGWDRSISMIEGETTVKAQWLEYDFQVVFQSNGGRTENNEETVVIKVNSAFELKQKQPNFIKEGYALSWDKNLSSITSSCTVNAVWTPKQYNLEFLDKDGLSFDNNVIQVAYKEQLGDINVLPPKVSGKRFAYWTEGNSLDALSIDKGIVWDQDKSATFYPNYVDEDHFIIKYDLDGGERGKRTYFYSANTSQDANILFDATRKGYNFEGWLIGDSQTPKLSNKITINDFKNADGEYQDVTLKASWGNRPYVINYDAQGGVFAGETSKEVKYNDLIGELPIVQKQGYLFEGWYYDGKIINENDLWEYPNDATLTAKYLAEYKVKFSLTTKISTNAKDITCEVKDFGSVPKGNADFEQVELTIVEGQSLYTALKFTKLPVVKPIEQGSQPEYEFGGYWKWIDDNGNEHVIETTTIFSGDIFMGVQGGETITLVPHCRAIWSPSA